MAKFIDLLGHGEITLKSDTEPAIIAFRNPAAQMCKESNGLIENAVMLMRGFMEASNLTLK